MSDESDDVVADAGVPVVGDGGDAVVAVVVAAADHLVHSNEHHTDVPAVRQLHVQFDDVPLFCPSCYPASTPLCDTWRW